MAIDRKGMGMGVDMGMPEEPDVNGENAQEESGETIELSAAMLGGQSVEPGDIIKLEAVSVDPESGNVTARYAMPNKTRGIDEMASEFD